MADTDNIRPAPANPMTTADLARAGEEPAVDRVQTADYQADDAPPSLFAEQEVGDLRHQWDTIQTGFVDEPRRAVENADALVASTMKRLAETFASERSGLEAQWDKGDDVSTEDLRIALQRYRAFFGRLLSV